MKNAHATRAEVARHKLLLAYRRGQRSLGELNAGDYLFHLEAGLARRDDLAEWVTKLKGDRLVGFCRALQKTLKARHG